jgi:hypothetical protein
MTRRPNHGVPTTEFPNRVPIPVVHGVPQQGSLTGVPIPAVHGVPTQGSHPGGSRLTELALSPGRVHVDADLANTNLVIANLVIANPVNANFVIREPRDRELWKREPCELACREPVGEPCEGNPVVPYLLNNPT